MRLKNPMTHVEFELRVKFWQMKTYTVESTRWTAFDGAAATDGDKAVAWGGRGGAAAPDSD